MGRIALLLSMVLLGAVTLATPVVRDDPPLPRFEALLAEGRFVEARAGLEPHVATAPDDALARCLLAHALVALGEATAALAHADVAARLAPAWASPWYQRGRALLLQHEFAAADHAFALARERVPEWESAWRDHFHALAALGLGDRPRAAELFSCSPEAQPPGGPEFLFERMAALWPIVPAPEPARRWYREAAQQWFGPADGAPPKQAARRVPFDLAPPVRGEWRVVQGPFGDESHFGIAGSHALDLMQVEDGRLARGSGDERERFFAFGAEVTAPAAARVVAVVSHHLDHAARAGDRTPLLAPDVAHAPLGNHVVLELAPDAFLLLAHLAHGSIAVRRGDLVARGQRLGAIGMTGVTWAPHLHLVVWSQLAPAASRPLRFLDARRRDAAGRLQPRESFTPAVGESVIAR